MGQINRGKILVKRTGGYRCPGSTFQKTVLSPSPTFHDLGWGAAWSWRVVQRMLLSKTWDPVTGVCGRRQVHYADLCLAGDVYLDNFTSWCLWQSACTDCSQLKISLKGGKYAMLQHCMRIQFYSNTNRKNYTIQERNGAKAYSSSSPSELPESESARSQISDLCRDTQQKHLSKTWNGLMLGPKIWVSQHSGASIN